MQTQDNQLWLEQRVEILGRLRDARARVLRDAESFHPASTALEHIGQILKGAVGRGLAHYESAILALATKSGRHEREEARRLFAVVRQARNMAVHEGAWARHLSTRLVELFLVLEEAITHEMTLVTDLMVRNPATLETWHLVAHARRVMLENSFSCLPIFAGPEGGESWHLLTDAAIVRFLRGAKTDQEYKNRVSSPLGAALANGSIRVVEAVCCHSQTTVLELVPEMTDLPALITQGESPRPQLLGIIAPFDLL